VLGNLFKPNKDEAAIAAAEQELMEAREDAEINEIVEDAFRLKVVQPLPTTRVPLEGPIDMCECTCGTCDSNCEFANIEMKAPPKPKYKTGKKR